MKSVLRYCVVLVGIVGLCIFFFHLGSLSVVLLDDDFALEEALLFTTSSQYSCVEPVHSYYDDDDDNGDDGGGGDDDDDDNDDDGKQIERELVEKELDKMATAHEQESAAQQQQQQQSSLETKPTESTPFPFGEGTSQFALHAAHTSRRDFLETFGLGFLSPQSSNEQGSNVLLFSNSRPFPLDEEEENGNRNEIPFIANAQKATEHCHELNVIVVNKDASQQCTALVSNYESYHVQNWQRRKSKDKQGRGGKKKKKTETTNDTLQIEGRLAQVDRKDGTVSVPLPSREVVDAYWEIFHTLLRTLSDVQATLTELFESLPRRAGLAPLVCSAPQVVYLVNLYCSNVLPVSQLLVISMDEETHEAAQWLGLASFYDETLLESLRQSSTKVQRTEKKKKKKKKDSDGEATLRSVLKLLSLHWVQTLERDVLLFDVERVVWLQNPMEFFSASREDVILTEEESSSSVYAPYGSNCMRTAYVRYSVASRHFGVTALYAGDVLLLPQDDDDDQFGKLMSVRLAEYSNLYGLKVKVMKNSDDGTRWFPVVTAKTKKDRWEDDVVALRLAQGGDDPTAPWKKGAWNVKPNTCSKKTTKSASSCCKAK